MAVEEGGGAGSTYTIPRVPLPHYPPACRPPLTLSQLV